MKKKIYILVIIANVCYTIKEIFKLVCNICREGIRTMSIKVAINGFGRIGRMVYRRILQEKDIEIVAVNASYSPEQLAHMLKYDTVHGKLDADIKFTDDSILVDGQETKIISERDPKKLPWAQLDIEIVVEATGKFRQGDAARQHVEAGAKKVVITAPAKDGEDVTVVMGVNEENYDYSTHEIISNASCTTNCLAPIIKVLHDNFQIEQGMMTTIHSYTNDQKILDNMHKDLRRSRAAAQSIIPTSSGATKAISDIFPELDGKLKGLALRVPTPNVSIVDLVVNVKEKVTTEKVNKLFKQVSVGSMKNIIGYTEEPLVSTDFVGNDNSCIIDALSTIIVDENQLKILAWYDNEWGYSCRVVDLVKYVSFAESQKRDNKILTA